MIAPEPHRCHARGCRRAVEPKFLMCPAHWRRVPKRIQAQIWKHYVPGQELRKDPTPEYLAVMQSAINAVAAYERRD